MRQKHSYGRTEISLPKASEFTLLQYVQILNENGFMNSNYLLNPQKSISSCIRLSNLWGKETMIFTHRVSGKYQRLWRSLPLLKGLRKLVERVKEKPKGNFMDYYVICVPGTNGMKNIFSDKHQIHITPSSKSTQCFPPPCLLSRYLLGRTWYSHKYC